MSAARALTCSRKASGRISRSRFTKGPCGPSARLRRPGIAQRSNIGRRPLNLECFAAAYDRAKLALVALSFRLAATRVSHFAAVARADAGTSDSLTGRLETVKLSPCAHAPSERRYHESQNEIRMSPYIQQRDFSGGTQ
jgi:hypothetical protein